MSLQVFGILQLIVELQDGWKVQNNLLFISLSNLSGAVPPSSRCCLGLGLQVLCVSEFQSLRDLGLEGSIS